MLPRPATGGTPTIIDVNVDEFGQLVFSGEGGKDCEEYTIGDIFSLNTEQPNLSHLESITTEAEPIEYEPEDIEVEDYSEMQWNERPYLPSFF